MSNDIVFDQQLDLAKSEKKLGVIMDQNLSMENHVSYIGKTFYLEQRKNSHIRPFISKDVANKLVCSFVLSRIDYCNSLFSGLPKFLIDRHQQIQNHAACRETTQLPLF